MGNRRHEAQKFSPLLFVKSPFLPCPASFHRRRALSLFLTLDHHHPHLIKSISSHQNQTTSPFLSASLLISTLFFLIVLSSAIPSSLWFRWAATFSVTVNVYVFHQHHLLEPSSSSPSSELLLAVCESMCHCSSSRQQPSTSSSFVLLFGGTVVVVEVVADWSGTSGRFRWPWTLPLSSEMSAIEVGSLLSFWLMLVSN